MPISNGYVLEGVRVGQANSSFTQTPDNYISDQVVFDAAYPADESQPRTEYLSLVFDEGTPIAGLLVNAKFGWTKNEVINRFGYLARLGRFQPLPGAVLASSGVLGPTSNTTRITVKPPAQAAPWPDAPYRLSVGSTASGQTFTVTIVATNGAFTSPLSLTVQLSLESGDLNWNATDLSTYSGQSVWFQQQQFFGPDESTGQLGLAPVLLSDPALFLNPKPATGQFPLLRFGFGFYLQTVEVANDGLLTPLPAVGTVKWSLATGRLAFNATDAAGAVPLYYDGVLFARNLSLPRQNLGTVLAPSAIVGLPPIGGDLIFALPSVTPYYQFPNVVYTTKPFTAGSTGLVQVNPDTGAVQFSTADIATYGSDAVRVIFGDLPIERGISLRLFRTPVNLAASGTLEVPSFDWATPSIDWANPKDITRLYEVPGAVWADPIIGSPQVFLPSTPLDSATYPFRVKVLQGQGTFTSDDFQNLALNINGTGASFTGVIFTDPSASFITAGVKVGSMLVVKNTAAQGQYIVATVAPTVLTLTSAAPSPVVGVIYSIYPPAVRGYFIDFDAGVLFFAQRKANVTIQTEQPVGALVLPDPLVLTGNLLLDLDNVPLVLGEDALFDSTSGIVSFIDNRGTILAQGTGGTISGGTLLTDLTAGFILAGVVAGNLVEIVAPTGNVGIYTVVARTATTLTLDAISPNTVGVQYKVHDSREVLADRFFAEVALVDPSTKVERVRSLGVATNAPRLNIPVNYVATSRFRFGPSTGGQFPTVVLVPNNGAFTSPPTGTIQVSIASGDLNFATADLGSNVYWIRVLVPKAEYLMQPGLGLVSFTERFLRNEEAIITYTTAPPSTDPPTDPGAPVTEYATFLIRKEVTAAHPVPTSTLTFNPDNFPVADFPPPAVFRGGRPQQVGVQCLVNTLASTITFLSDSQITDALPHGATVNPNERVYIDYYVTQAVGGEQTITVITPPILTAMVVINELDANGNPNNQFVVHGDQTANFPANYLMRIEQQELYLIGSSTYAPGPNETTVVLYGSQVFQNSYTDPKVFVSSGVITLTAAPLVPSYFVAEMEPFEAIAKGMDKFFIAGDRTEFYKTGTVVWFTDGGMTFTDFLQVSGSSFKSGRTLVTLSTNAPRQYVSPTQVLSYSIRSIFEDPTLEVRTSKVPVLTQPYLVYRRVLGAPATAGVILSSPMDYTIDDSGRVIFTSALLPSEEFSIFYTGVRVIPAGHELKATYTCQIAPNSTNGLEGQTLVADYYIQSPDTFFYRVETMTNFRGEYSKELEADASSGSSGPPSSNASQPKLFEQGRTSLYFDEHHLANQDIVARSSLLFYNNLVNSLEDLLRWLDGRVVGNNDGPFLFDGTTGIVNPSGSATFSSTTTLDDPNANFTTVLIGRTVEILSGTNKLQKRQITAVPLVTQLTLSPALPTTASGRYRVLALNQIDDLIQISAAPYKITFAFPNFTVVSIGTYKKSYTPGALSRFYPTSRDFFGVPAVTADSETGDEVLDTGSTNVTLVSNLRTRLAFAVLTESSATSGPTLKVDDADGSEEYARPPFSVGMECVVQLRDGTFINDVGSPATVSGVTATTITVTGLGGVADIGATIYQSPKDTSAPPNTYILGSDYVFNGENGQVIYIGDLSPFLMNNPLPVPSVALSGKVTFINSLTAPFKFPALYGKAEDDDGDLSFPIQRLDPVNELNGSLSIEDSIIHPVTGTLRTSTTAPFIGVGTLFVANVITNSGPFVAPLPEINDLVRILTGSNALSPFVRITAVGASTITVATAFLLDAGFTYEIALSSLAITGLAINTTFPTTTTLMDTAASFIVAGVQPGFTLVLPSGARRQITEVTSATVITFTPALVSGPTNYRIDNSLATYGGTPGDYLTALEAALDGEQDIYPGEQAAILAFLNEAFTDIVVSAMGSTVSTAVLTDLSVNFLFSEVNTSHLVFIQSGGDAGIYQILSVDSATQLTMTTPFPATLAGVSYRVVSAFGVSAASLIAMFDIYLSIGTLLASAIAFKTLITTPVSVIGLPCFTRATLTSDLDTRNTIVDARLAAVPTDLALTDEILNNTDALYDKRYVWIDARINLESGLVVQQATAVVNRIKNQAAIYNQLVKLLAVQE